MKIVILIPAYNEENALPAVLSDLKKVFDGPVYILNNNSTDRTADVSRSHGAKVIDVPIRGYGEACLAGIAGLPSDAELVVFMDGDRSDFAEDLPKLIEPILTNQADLVIGARQPVEGGALTPQQKWGNALACFLIRLFYGFQYTDLGPFRAIRKSSLDQLRMDDRAFGWTVQMQLRAIKHRLRIQEIPVRYRARIGVSKISGTLMGSIRAGRTILWTIAKEWLS